MTYNETGSGGAIGGITGSQEDINQIICNPVLAGGSIANGSIIVAATYMPINSSGILIDGQAEIIIGFLASGGVIDNGTVIVPLSGYISQGGELLSGQVIHTMIMQDAFQGGEILNGQGNDKFLRIFFYTASGQIVITGSAPSGIPERHFRATGSVQVNGLGSAIVSLKLNKNIVFSWGIQATIIQDFVFYWNLGQLEIFWYRVIGQGIPGNVCPPLNADPCCQKFILNIHARTLTELCQKLSNRGYQFPIQSVEQFSRPAENSVIAAQAATGVVDNCNTLTPVQICNIPQCAEFCIDQDLNMSFGFSMFQQLDAFFSYTAAGSVYINGSATSTFSVNTTNFNYVATGNVLITGGAEFQVDYYIGNGGIALGGEAYSEFSHWSFIGGVWPSITQDSPGNFTESISEDSSEQTWSLTDRALVADGLYTSSDISFGKTTQLLVIQDFNLQIPEDFNVLGLYVTIIRYATQVGVRDLEVFLVSGNDIISDNLADVNNDWPLIPSSKIYGSNGIDDLTPWRNLTTDDFTVNLTADQLNNSDFGVALKVISESAMPSTVVKVDYISVQAFYEDPNGSIVRISGVASVIGPNYNYVSSGRKFIGGSAKTTVDLFFRSHGLGSDLNGAVNLIGSSSYVYSEISSGGSISNGEAVVEPYFEISSGGSTLNGEADVQPYLEFPLGGANVGGSGILQYHYRYVASGDITLTSATFLGAQNYSYIATGGPVFSGHSYIVSSAWAFVASGSIGMSGSAEIDSSDLGVKFQSIGFGMSILQTNIDFLSDIDERNLVAPSGTLIQCTCTSLPFIIYLTHNFSINNIFANFLVINNFTIPTTYSLRYNKTNNSWQTNLHYKGLSADTNVEEVWDIITELQCASVVGGINIGTSIWKLSIQINRTNLVNFATASTRIIIGILPTNLCGVVGDQLNFKVSYDTQLGVSTVYPNAQIYQNSIFDNIGLFKNPAWIQEPNLVLSVSQVGLPATASRLNLTSSVFVD